MPTDHRNRPYRFWLAIATVLFAMGLLFGSHLISRQTPDPIAFIFPFINFPVYWYGVVVTSAIAFGCYVAAQLALTEAIKIFEHHVPESLRGLSLGQWQLPQGLIEKLQEIKIGTVGELIWQMGVSVKGLGISAENQQHLSNQLATLEEFDPAWLHDRPWRRWSPEHVWNSVVWALIPGMIGARLYHVLTPQPSLGITPLFYLQNPLEIFNFRNGGLGIFGAIAGGALGLLLYVRRHHLPLADWVDLAAITGALIQFIARWANYFNQELFGSPTTLPWGLTVDRPPAGFDSLTRFHPAFLYESLWSFFTFLLLIYWWRRVTPGRIVATYLICYGFGRILLETIRLDSNVTGNLPTASLVSGGMILLGVLIHFLLRQQSVSE